MAVHIKRLQLEVGETDLSVGTLRLDQGKIYGLLDDDGPRAELFVTYLSGIKAALVRSSPAASGQLLREESTPAIAALRALKIDGRAIYELPNHERAREIGVVFENPETSILGATVIEELWYAFAAIHAPIPPMHALVPYELYEKRFQQTETLSGGEKHRLNCATVLEIARKLYVIDFSSSNLDRIFLQKFLGWLRTRVHAGATALVYGLRPGEIPGVDTYLTVARAGIEAVTPDATLHPDATSELKILAARLTRQVSTQPTHLNVNEAWGQFSSAGATFEVKGNEIVIVEAPNGAGKTTLGRLIANNEQPAKGRFTLHSEALPVMAFQHGEHCFLADSIWRELPDPAVLNLCGISETEYGEDPRNLERSRQKLLAVAIALFLSRGFAILDEPTCGMDHRSKLRFVALLNHFSQLAVLVFTHDAAVHGLGRVVHLTDLYEGRQ